MILEEYISQYCNGVTNGNSTMLLLFLEDRTKGHESVHARSWTADLKQDDNTEGCDLHYWIDGKVYDYIGDYIIFRSFHT